MKVSHSKTIQSTTIIEIQKCNFTNWTMAINITVFYPKQNKAILPSPPKIKIEKSWFKVKSRFSIHECVKCFQSYFHWRILEGRPPKEKVSVGSLKDVAIEMTECKIVSIITDYIHTVMYLQGFWKYPARFTNNDIFVDFACGIHLNNSVLKLQGKNFINQERGDCQQLIMSYNSLIVFNDNSQLHFSEFKITHKKGNILLPPLEGFEGTYSEYVNCITGKAGCKGLCFFQFEHDSDHLLSSKEVLNHSSFIEPDIGLPKTEGTYFIYNGHLLNCRVETTDGLIAVDKTLFMKYLITPKIWKFIYNSTEEIISSPAYYICLCNEENLNNQSLWDCSQETYEVVPLGHQVSLYASVLGDLNSFIPLH